MSSSITAFKVLRSLLTAALGLSINLGAQAQSPIINGDFTTSINGWTVGIGGMETAVLWDGANGSPDPGSLRLTTTLDPPQVTIVDATSDCVNTIPNEILSISGMALKPTAQLGVTCKVTMVLYEGLDCTGNEIFSSGFPPNTPGVWEPSGIAVDVSTVILSIRPSLTMALNGP